MAYMAGGAVESSEESSEYGKTFVKTTNNILFKDIPGEFVCQMSHKDYVSSVPDGFEIIASTSKCPAAAMCDEKRKLYGLQFHPEVTHRLRQTDFS